MNLILEKYIGSITHTHYSNALSQLICCPFDTERDDVFDFNIDLAVELFQSTVLISIIFVVDTGDEHKACSSSGVIGQIILANVRLCLTNKC